MYTTFEDFHFVGVKCRAIDALYIISMLLIIDTERCFRVIGFMPSGPGDFLLSKPLKAAVIFSTFIQLVYFCCNSSLVIDFSGYTAVSYTHLTLPTTPYV